MLADHKNSKGFQACFSRRRTKSSSCRSRWQPRRPHCRVRGAGRAGSSSAACRIWGGTGALQRHRVAAAQRSIGRCNPLQHDAWRTPSPSVPMLTERYTVDMTNIASSTAFMQPIIVQPITPCTPFLQTVRSNQHTVAASPAAVAKRLLASGAPVMPLSR